MCAFMHVCLSLSHSSVFFNFIFKFLIADGWMDGWMDTTSKAPQDSRSAVSLLNRYFSDRGEKSVELRPLSASPFAALHHTTKECITSPAMTTEEVNEEKNEYSMNFDRSTANENDVNIKENNIIASKISSASEGGALNNRDDPELETVRLQKILSAAGICSRRRAEDLLQAGRVTLNGEVALVGSRANALRDNICVDGKPICKAKSPLLILLNKPVGVVCSCRDPEGRTTVLDLLPNEIAKGYGLHPVGRLDVDSRGALLLTNDGNLTLKMTHPRYGHSKTYHVRISGCPSETTLDRWREGVPLDDIGSQPVQVKVLSRQQRSVILEIEMREGRNRQIRRTAEILGHSVLDLQRISVGPFNLENLREGYWRIIDHRLSESCYKRDSIANDPYNN